MKRVLLIFDFDGTIADTAKIVMEVGNEVLSKYDLEAIDESRFEEMRERSVADLVRQFRFPLRKIPGLVTSIRSSLKQRIDELEPVDGMLDLLEEFDKKGSVDMAVLTSNSRENVQFFMRKYQILGYFDNVLAGVGVFTKYIKLRKLARAEPNDTLIIGIGDETRDIDAAKIAKIHSIGVDWGLNAKSKLETSRADYVVSSPNELRTVILKIIKQAE